jgi:hypothetical protein
MIVVTVIVGMFIMGIGRMRIGAMRIVMMFDLVATRMARMRANDRDGSRNDGADQRQKNNCLDHVEGQPFIRLTSSTAIEPRLRK